MPPRVVCLILNWRGAADTLACLAAVAAADYPNLEILVVDNGSGDDSTAVIRAAFPRQIILELPENRGFAGGNNAGIRWAQERSADYVWLLNSDARPESGALRAMVDLAARDPRMGAVGSVLLDLTPERRLQEWGGGWFQPWFGRFAAHQQPPAAGRLHYISGASLLIRMAAIAAIGLLDDRFFFYGEDIDFGIRLRRAGWRLGVAADARVLHRQAGSGLRQFRREFYLNAAAARLVRRHYPGAALLVPLGVLRRGLKSALLGRGRRLRAVISGTVAGWRCFRRDIPYGPLE